MNVYVRALIHIHTRIHAFLRQNPDGELLVLSMNEGGPAARSNLIKKDDVLYTIDGEFLQTEK
jgi:hypothetical protein